MRMLLNFGLVGSDMKRLVMIVFLFGSFLAQAKAPSVMRCQDSDGGLEPKVKGRVMATTLPQTCFQKSEKEKSCTEMTSTNPDYCKDENTLMEQYCDPNSGPQEKAITCPCQKGLCL